MPGCSGGQNSTVGRESGLCVCGVQSDSLSPFPYSGDVKIGWAEGHRHSS